MGQTKERLLLTQLSEGLLCAAFTDDGIPYRPTHRQPQRIRIIKRRESLQKKKRSRGSCGIKRPESPQKNKRPRRGPQPPVEMPTPEGPSLESAQSTMTPSQSQPEQRQGAYWTQDAMQRAQGYLKFSTYWAQSQQQRPLTQLQGGNPFSANISCDGRIHARGHLLTNAFAMSPPWSPQSQPRAQPYPSRWPSLRLVTLGSVTPRHTRPGAHAGAEMQVILEYNVPIVLRLAWV